MWHVTQLRVTWATTQSGCSSACIRLSCATWLILFACATWLPTCVVWLIPDIDQHASDCPVCATWLILNVCATRLIVCATWLSYMCDTSVICVIFQLYVWYFWMQVGVHQIVLFVRHDAFLLFVQRDSLHVPRDSIDNYMCDNSIRM